MKQDEQRAMSWPRPEAEGAVVMVRGWVSEVVDDDGEGGIEEDGVEEMRRLDVSMRMLTAKTEPVSRAQWVQWQQWVMRGGGRIE